MKKKIIFGALLLAGTLSLASCGTPTESSSKNTVSSNGSTTKPTEGNSSSNSTNTSTNTENTSTSTTPNTEVGPVEITNTKVYVVGDSTVCSFSGDISYYYPRYGYGTQLSQYLDSKAEIVNLALSGRSSKSFLLEANYDTLCSQIKEGDYLIIGFGHNDEKSDDVDRFTDASLPTSDPNSFNYSLYENYVKVAEEKGANPILCTPIVRLSNSNDYTGSQGHKPTINGVKVDYQQSIIDLGKEKNIPVVDLTKYTADLYTQIGSAEASYMHAWTNSKVASLDATHINIYGAKMVSYLFAEGLKTTDSSLKHYVKADIQAPTKEKDLVVNSTYVESTYESFDVDSYTPASVFKCTTDGWYGTAFGDLGSNNPASNYKATETAANTFEVGSTGGKGKISGSSEGFAFAFQRVSVSKNFTLKATLSLATVEKMQKQIGFGLMLRDDCYAPINDKTITSNSVCAGFYSTDTATNIVYSREATKLTSPAGTITGFVDPAMTAELEIVRLGQVVKCNVTYNGTTYTKTYTDFDFVAKDSQYMYIGMYSTRGIIAKFSNVEFTITGDAIAA